MTRLGLFARQERRSVTAALGLAMAAILFAQMILPGLFALAMDPLILSPSSDRLPTGAAARPSLERPVSP